MHVHVMKTMKQLKSHLTFPSLQTSSPPPMKQPILPILLLSIYTFLSWPSLVSAALRCPPCGRTPVPYPLSTGPNCGDQAYKLQCTTDGLYIVALNESSYLVTTILMETQRLIIRPAPILPDTCLSSDIRSQGIQLDPGLPFNITSSTTVLLMNCTDAMLNLQAPINCSSNCPCHTYIDSTPAAYQCKKHSLCCMFRTGGSQTAYILRVHGGGCSAYQSFVDLDTSLPVSKWPQPGLELEWASPQEPLCSSGSDCVELKNSKCLPDRSGRAVRRCFCRSGWRWDAIHGICQKCRHGMASCKIKRNYVPLTASVGSAFILCTSALIIYGQLFYKKKAAQKLLVKEREDMLNANNNGKSAKIFTGKELKKATNNFDKDNLLGSGGFGDVYKGILPDGTITAVKRAKPNNTKGTASVLNEVRILCQVNHRFLVRLLGCSVDLEQPLLVYEYVANGTLFDHLHGYFSMKRVPLTWHRRLIIALQTSQGLSYLHSSADPPIYHRDVKTSNILLDEKLDAKVSDFGLSRLVEPADANCTHINTSAQGTLGYLDPEYYLNLQLTDRSDVYSFGVVLMELLTSKKAIDFNREEEDINLAVYMKRILEQERLVDAIDPMLKQGASEVELDTMKALGYLAAACLDERRQNRPSMKEVAEEIEYIITIVTGEANNGAFVKQTVSKELKDHVLS